MLSFWDPKLKDSFNIDLWTKEMTMDEMKFFIFQNLLKMSGLIQKSTGDQELSKLIKNFATEFWKKIKCFKVIMYYIFRLCLKFHLFPSHFLLK